MIYILILLFILIVAVVYLYIKNYIKGTHIIGKLIISAGVLLFTLSIVIYPGESLSSALEGLTLWFNIVFPSLLPFFIGSELLVALGLVSFLGTLLEPVMRPLFRVPGCGSFPFVMSITSGYPVGARIVAEIYNKKMCSKIEAQRLLSFCSTSGPLFMIGAVGIGMLNVRESGMIIALSHYLGAITIGIIFRFYKYREDEMKIIRSGSLKEAIKNLLDSFKKEKRPLGLLLSNCVKNSINSILMIGGFIILFSVIIRIMSLTGIISILSRALYIILFPLGIDSSLLKPITSSLFEITVGSKLIASSRAPLMQCIIAASGIIAWSGLSIHAQVAGMISTTDLKVSTYIVSKLLHSVLSCIYAYLLLSLINVKNLLSILEAFSYNNITAINNYSWFLRFTLSSEKFFYIIIGFMAAVIIFKALSRLYSSLKN